MSTSSFSRSRCYVVFGGCNSGVFTEQFAFAYYTNWMANSFTDRLSQILRALIIFLLPFIVWQLNMPGNLTASNLFSRLRISMKTLCLLMLLAPFWLPTLHMVCFSGSDTKNLSQVSIVFFLVLRQVFTLHGASNIFLCHSNNCWNYYPGKIAITPSRAFSAQNTRNSLRLPMWLRGWSWRVISPTYSRQRRTKYTVP